MAAIMNDGYKTIAVTNWNTLRFSWQTTAVSVQNNTSTIQWKLELISGSDGRINSTVPKKWSVTVNGTKYSGTNTVGIANNTQKTLASGTTTIKHGNDGKKTFDYTFSQEFGIVLSGVRIGTKSGSGSGVLGTIAVKSTLSASNGTLGTAQTLTVTRQSTNTTHTITYKCGSASGMICDKSSNTIISWTPPISLAKQNTTGDIVSVALTITTYNGDTSLGANTKTISCEIPASVSPTVSVSFSDASGYYEIFGYYVEGLSRLKVNITAAGSQGSAIKSYSTTVNGKKYTASSFETDVLTGGGSITAIVTDSRARIALANEQITVGAYALPQITDFTVSRCDADGNADKNGAYMAVRFSATVHRAGMANTAAYTVEYKKTSADTYNTQTLTEYANTFTVSNGVYIFAADKNASYDVRLSVTDKTKTVYKTAVGASVGKVLSMLKNGADIVGVALGKVAEWEGVFEIAWKTRFTGGILHPTLEPETDLNDVRTPNTYIGANVSTYNYGNCPLTSGTFTLEVVGMGDAGQTKQRLTYCHKTAAKAWERIFYADAWGEWMCVSDFGGQLLWDGVYHMSADQTATLPELVSKQKSGIVLVFSEYVDGEAKNQTFCTHFVPKKVVELHNGGGHSIQLSTTKCDYFAAKYLYIYNDRIVGHANNNATGAGACGITYTNNRFVLRYVIGV